MSSGKWRPFRHGLYVLSVVSGSCELSFLLSGIRPPMSGSLEKEVAHSKNTALSVMIILHLSESMGITHQPIGRFEWNFKIIFKLISMIENWCISCEVACRWMPHNTCQNTMYNAHDCLAVLKLHVYDKSLSDMHYWKIMDMILDQHIYIHIYIYTYVLHQVLVICCFNM